MKDKQVRCSLCYRAIDATCRDKYHGHRICNVCSDRILQEAEESGRFPEGWEGSIISLETMERNGETYYSLNRRPVPKQFWENLPYEIVPDGDE